MEKWAREFEGYFTQYREAYRERVNTYWPNEYAQVPGAFPIVASTEALAVATMATGWVFVRPAKADAVRVEKAWAHDVLGDWKFENAPKGHRERMIRQLLNLDSQWVLFDTMESLGSFTAGTFMLLADPRTRANLQADSHAWNAQHQLTFSLDAVDQGALDAIQARLHGLEKSTDFQRRGREFEAVMVKLLTAHGCLVERGLPGEAEQVDVFMTDPVYALIECRWEKQPLEAKVIRDLSGKLATRPAIVVGLYVSMSGFAAGAKSTAKNARDRAIALVDRADVLALARGETTFRRFWRERMRELVLRYPG